MSSLKQMCSNEPCDNLIPAQIGPGLCPRCRASRPKRQRAVITDSGRPGYNYGEPRARLADGREMPMGWSAGKTYPVGTEGLAEYISTGSASLWKFTPDQNDN